MSLCEWDPERGMAATELRESRRVGLRIERVLVERCGCPDEAVIVLGAHGDWHLCASCADLPAFRKFRIAQLLDADVVLHRNSAGWWAEGALVPPAALAEVLARLAGPRPWTCEHGRTFKEGCARCGPLMVLS